MNRRQLLGGILRGLVAAPLLPLVKLASPSLPPTAKPLSGMTYLYVSPEAMEDIQNWSIYQIDDAVRREIFCA